MLRILPTLRRKRFGFSLIELMIALVILSISLLLGMPSYKAWIQNTQIRNAAESVLYGMQRARSEAVGRNTSVAFVFGAGTDSSWTVRVVDTAEVVTSLSGNEGSRNVTRAVLPANATTITFGSLGLVVTNADASASLMRVDLDVPTTVLSAADSRDLSIVVGVGGGVRMCDPNVIVVTDPRHC